MSKQLILGLLICITLMFSPASELSTPLAGAAPATIAVPDDYSTIQEAMNNAVPALAWNKTYGGAGSDFSLALVQTVDGGYALTGRTYSFGAGSSDIWLVKTDENGNHLWNRTYGGTEDDRTSSLIQTADGGFALAGTTYSFGAGSSDIWLVRTDAFGNHLWNRTYGGTREDDVFAFVQTVDGGFALAGHTYSFGAGSCDAWLVKTSADGSHEWNETLGGIAEDFACRLIQTNDEGYILAGSTKSYGAGNDDFWLVKTAGVASTITVPDDYATIQEAVDNAMDGDTIFVKTGTYYENVIVRKSVSIVAESRADTVISGNGTGKVFNIVQDATNITGFSIKESGGYPEGACIFLDNVTGCSVLANVIDNSNTNSPDPAGIFLNSSDGNTIAWNIITNNTIGLNIISSSNNMITENSIENTHLGMQVSFSSSNNRIFENCLTNCDYGLSLDHAAMNNSVCRNHVERSSIAGVALETASDSNFVIANVIVSNAYGIRILWSSSNTFYHNNIVNNSVQVYVSGGYTNMWNSQYPSGGNYWSGYNGTDLSSGLYQNETGSDGIGDTDCVIYANNIDRYPLKGMFLDHEASSECHVQTICNSTLSDFQFNGTAIRFNVSGESGTAGFCRVCIPTALMNETYYAFVNGTEVLPNLLTCSNATHSHLYFDYMHSVQEVVILPEFPSFLIPPLFMIATLSAVIIYKRRRLSSETQKKRGFARDFAT